MDLSRVDLATLSACETGLGQTAGGEGLLGLQRAFQIAGAKSTVASLWQVRTGRRRPLMSRFYENVWQPGACRSCRHCARLRCWLIHKAQQSSPSCSAEDWPLIPLLKRKHRSAGSAVPVLLGGLRVKRRLEIMWFIDRTANKTTFRTTFLVGAVA